MNNPLLNTRRALPAVAGLLASLASLLPLTVQAAKLVAEVKDATGAALADAIIYAEPVSGTAPRQKRDIQIEQQNKEFVPLVSVMQAGSSVNFPNRDSIRHHVYSFSPAKTFEIKLYSGVPANPVVFDKAGEVVLGCNIHDTMIAYLLVVETPWFGKSGANGKATIDLPAGEYKFTIWHYAAAAPATQRVTVKGDAAQNVNFSVTLKPQPPRPPR